MNSIKNWPFDKQLTLIFPLSIFLIALISGSVFLMEPGENKVALAAGGIYIFLTLALQPFLRMKKFTEKTEWFLREFWPVLAILLGYLTMRIFRLELAIEQFGIPQQDLLMISIDEALFGQTLPLYIQHWITPELSFYMESSYLHFYYLLPIGSLIYFSWSEQKQQFLQLRKGIIYTLAGGFSLYFVLPVVGPISFMPDAFSVPLIANHEVVYDAVNSFRFTYDCFPSLHTAIPWLTVFLIWSSSANSIRAIILLMAFSITLSTMYLRYHYGADVIAGFIWALLVAALVMKAQDSDMAALQAEQKRTE